MQKLLLRFRSLIKSPVWAILFLVTICVLLANFSFDGIRYTRYISPKTVEVSPMDAYTYMQAHPNTYKFLDVRTIGEYSLLHAVNSTSNPIGHFYDDWKTLPRDKGTKIYLICTTGRLATVAYGFLQLHGFTNIVHVTGGLQDWIKEGLPVNRGLNTVDSAFSLDKPVE